MEACILFMIIPDNSVDRQVRSKQVTSAKANTFSIPTDYLITGLLLLLLVRAPPPIPEKTMSAQEVGSLRTGHRDLGRLSVSGARVAHSPQTWKPSPKQASKCCPRAPGPMSHQHGKSRFSLIFLKKNTTMGHTKSVFIILLLSSFSLGKVQTPNRRNSLGVQFLGV